MRAIALLVCAMHVFGSWLLFVSRPFAQAAIMLLMLTDCFHASHSEYRVSNALTGICVVGAKCVLSQRTVHSPMTLWSSTGCFLQEACASLHVCSCKQSLHDRFARVLVALIFLLDAQAHSCITC